MLKQVKLSTMIAVCIKIAARLLWLYLTIYHSIDVPGDALIFVEAHSAMA